MQTGTVPALIRLVPLLVLGLAGCSGAVESAPGEPAGIAGDPGVSAAGGNVGHSGSGGSGSASGSGNASGSGASHPAAPGVSPTTRVARLTHAQYKNTVSELFGITDDVTAGFAPDAANGFDFATSVDLRVDARLGPQYRTAAEALAERTVSDASVFGRVVGCDPAAPSCADEFIASFGRRAYRRPLSSSESARFRVLFDEGAALVASGDAFRDGVRMVVESALQAPQFLYRTETSAMVGSDGLIALDGHELATRLSYMLWDSMPDPALAQLADAGALVTEADLQTAAARLLADPRALAKAVSFHAEAWEFSRFARISPDPVTFPNLPSDFVTRVRASSERFVAETLRGGGGLQELLTAPVAYVDSALAPLYGQSVSGSELTRIELTDRKGYLMQLGFLASNAYTKKTDPIHRGVFVLRRLLCRTIDDPPAGASTTPLPAADPPPRTTREEVALLTEQPACRGCHSDINPPGFALEAFDAIGQRRAMDNGVAVDTAAESEIDGALVPYADANELVTALATSPEAQACYAGRWLEFAFGRELTDEDRAARTLLSAERLGGLALLAKVTALPAFRKRLPNEVGP
jgi:hypothetical protein